MNNQVTGSSQIYAPSVACQQEYSQNYPTYYSYANYPSYYGQQMYTNQNNTYYSQPQTSYPVDTTAQQLPYSTNTINPLEPAQLLPNNSIQNFSATPQTNTQFSVPVSGLSSVSPMTVYVSSQPSIPVNQTKKIQNDHNSDSCCIFC